MKYLKTKKCKIPMMNKDKKELFFNDHKAIGTQLHITINDVKYQLFLQDKVDHWKDIRLNNPNVGIIVDKVFFKCGTLETLRNNLMVEKLERHLEKINFNVNEAIDKMFNQCKVGA